MRTLYESILDDDEEISRQTRLRLSYFNSTIRQIFKKTFGKFCCVDEPEYYIQGDTVAYLLCRPTKDIRHTRKQFIKLGQLFYNTIRKEYKVGPLYTVDLTDDDPYIVFKFIEMPDEWEDNPKLLIGLLEGDDGVYVGIDISDDGIGEIFAEK